MIELGSLDAFLQARGNSLTKCKYYIENQKYSVPRICKVLPTLPNSSWLYSLTLHRTQWWWWWDRQRFHHHQHVRWYLTVGEGFRFNPPTPQRVKKGHTNMPVLPRSYYIITKTGWYRRNQIVYNLGEFGQLQVNPTHAYFPRSQLLQNSPKW